MPKEVRTDSQPFMAFPRYRVRSRKAALRELSQPCGQFRFPLSTEEKLRLLVSGNLGKIDMLENSTLIGAGGTPLNWYALLRYLHDSGIIAEPAFSYTPLRNDLPKYFAMTLRAEWNKAHTDGRRVNSDGNGHAQSAEIAMSKAVGETLERHLLTQYMNKDLTVASYKELAQRRERVVRIEKFNGFLPWQSERFPYFARSEGSPLCWVEGEDLDGNPLLVPAQSVFWNYNFGHAVGEPVLFQPTTSGAGAHFTKKGAILSGLLECIERDGFLIYWLNAIAPRRIDVSGIQQEEVQGVLQLMRRYGLEAHFLNTTTDVGIPSVVCVILDNRTGVPMLAVGGGIGFDIESTIVHSAYETLIVLNQAERFDDFPMPENFEPFSNEEIGHLVRLRLWRGVDMVPRISFFLQGPVQSFDAFMGDTPRNMLTEEAFEYTKKKLSSLGEGYAPAIYSVDHPVLKTLGYHVVKTIVPALVPLYLHEHMATLDSTRLREVPRSLGYEAVHVYNPTPHPFP